jgi:hypothetical protein
MNIGINNNVEPPTIITTYPPDPSVPMTSVGGITRNILPNGSADIILTDITTTLPVPCGTPTVIIADLWSSQAAQAQVAHCVNCGIMYAAGYMGAAGLANCSTASYNVTLTNATSTALSGYYRVYADINGDGYFTPSIDTLIQDTTSYSVGAGAGTTATISGPIPTANLNQDLFFLFTQTSGSASGASRIVLVPSTQCSPLPVTFRSFTATRMSTNTVGLRWETVTEINNSGFAVQRNIGNNIWQTIAFVNSQAQGGNSNSILTYTYNDVNNYKGISQYRIKQVDLDNKVRYSEIRAVRGDGQKGNTIVYPNPSNNGTVNIVFKDNESVKDISLMDSYGRVIRRWNGVTSNTIQIENLGAGMYNVRIVNRISGEQETQKIVVY